jgi:hypothetical protein
VLLENRSEIGDGDFLSHSNGSNVPRGGGFSPSGPLPQAGKSADAAKAPTLGRFCPRAANK